LACFLRGATRSSAAMATTALRLGIDLGGTKTLGVLLDAKGTVVAEHKVETPASVGYAGTITHLAKVAAEVCAKGGLNAADRKRLPAIGLGLPGPVDPDRGVVLRAVNLGWKVPQFIGKDLAQAFGLRVVLGNDVNFGALGEVMHGAATGAKTACAAFVGTGFGGALIRDGHVVNGSHGIAGELGHLRAPWGNARCGCGNRGCLETVCSKRGIARQLLKAHIEGEHCEIPRKKLVHLKSSQLKQALKEGCPATRRAVRTASEALGWGLAAFGAVADPQVYIVGGGVIEALHKRMLPVVLATMAKQCVFFQGRQVDLRRAMLGDHAVAVGAAAATGLKEHTRW